MPRVKRGTVRNAKRKKLLKRAKGYFLTKSKLYQSAQEAVAKADNYAFSGRRRKKRDFRALWVVRINAAARLHGLTYGKLINGMKLAGIELDRRTLGDIWVNHAGGFGVVAEKAKCAMAKAEPKNLAGLQSGWVAVGIVAMLVFTFVDYRLLLDIALPLWIVGLVLLTWLLIWGQETAKVNSWIHIGSFQFQPSAFVQAFDGEAHRWPLPTTVSTAPVARSSDRITLL